MTRLLSRTRCPHLSMRCACDSIPLHGTITQVWGMSIWDVRLCRLCLFVLKPMYIKHASFIFVLYKYLQILHTLLTVSLCNVLIARTIKGKLPNWLLSYFDGSLRNVFMNVVVVFLNDQTYVWDSCVFITVYHSSYFCWIVSMSKRWKSLWRRLWQAML